MIKVFHTKFLTNPELASEEIFNVHCKVTIRNDIDTAKEVLGGKYKGRYEYVEVAAVGTNDLEEAFHLTNHIDEDWTTNFHVTAIGNRHRSSSTGDIFEKDGRKYLVSGFGFTEVI